MKAILTYTAVLLFAIVNINLFANYSTPGQYKNWTLDSLVTYSSGVVTYSSGNYYINDTLTVSESDTLKIFHDAVIKMSGMVLININGVLQINPPNSVVMTAADTNSKYVGIRMDSLSDGSYLKKLTFEYANAIKMLDCNILIDSCIIRYNTLSSTFSSGAINLFRSNSTISNCQIYRNRRAAIISGANIASSPKIIGNYIYENDIENYNTPQINLGAATSEPVEILNNRIFGYFNKAGGIAFLAIGSVPNLIIKDNIIKYNRYGIALLSGNINAYICGNIIDSNNIEGNPLTGGSGLNFNANSTLTAIVSRNIIRWNLWGVTIQGTAKPNLGNLNNPDTTDNGYNFLYGNYHNDTTIDLYNNTPDSIMAENNYWGTTNLDTIEHHIFHKPDNPSLGFVDYLPIYMPTYAVTQNPELPENFRFDEPYPNPFNSSVMLKFTIGRNNTSRLIELCVYDILGRKVAVILKKQFAEGSYSILFSAGYLPSGIYFIRLTDGVTNIDKRIVLLK